MITKSNSIVASLTGVLLTASIFLAQAVFGEDAVTADPSHYTVALENDHVRVVRISYGAGEESVMHEHLRPGAVIFVTDAHTRMTMPDGTTTEDTVEAGTVQWAEPTMHMPANLSDEPFEVIYVEIK